jgi:paired small multidrug resistance pump
MHSEFLNQGLSLAGAAFILVGYVGQQFKWMDSEGAPYNIINAFGSALLGWVALFPFKIGFVVLEFAWVVVSVYGLWKGQQRRRARTS